MKMKFILFISLALSACNFDSQDKSSPISIQNSHNEIVEKMPSQGTEINGDTMIPKGILFPLNKFYSPKVINLIKNKRYFESSSRILMGFDIIGDSILFANNDKQRLEYFNVGEKDFELIKFENYPKFLVDNYSTEPKSIERIERISFDEIMFSSFGYLYGKYYESKHDWKLMSNNGSFGKESFRYVKQVNGHLILGLEELVSNNEFILNNRFWDLVIDDQSKSLRGVFINENDSVGYYSSTQIHPSWIPLSNEDITYEDADIIYSNSSLICFVLKTSDLIKYNDVLIVYDVKAKAIRTKTPLYSKYNYPTHYGDPGVFITGSTYKLIEKTLWRMRTTSEGVCLESWDIYINSHTRQD